MKKLLILILSVISLTGFGQNGLVTNDGFPIYFMHGGHRAALVIPSDTSVYASEYGFLPSASASDNTAAWNSIPAGKYIKICDTGTYNISNTLLLKSNSTYYFCNNIKVKKTADFSHLFLNYNAKNAGRDSNIVFVGNGVQLIPNGHDIYSITDTNISPVLRLRALFQLYKVDRFTVDDFYMHDTTVTNQFTLNITDCSQGIISNVDIRTDKDAVDLVSCHDIACNNMKLYSRDDAFFVGVGYYSTTPVLKDSRNISLTNSEIGSSVAEQGFGVRLYSASWTKWINGRSYSTYAIVNNAGHTYIKGTTGNNIASVAPTHTSGHIQGADGIDWWYVQDGIDTVCNVDNVLIDNVELTSNRALCDLSSIYQEVGTYNNSILNDINFKNITVKSNYTNRLFWWRGHVDTLTIDKLTVDFDSTLTSGLLYSVQTTSSLLRSLNYFNLKNSTVNSNGSYVISLYNTSDAIQRIVVDSSTISVAGSAAMFCYSNVTTPSIPRVDFNYCNLSGSGNRFIRLRTNVFTTVNMTGCTLGNFERLIGIDQACSPTITLTNCTYVSPMTYAVVNTIAGAAVRYVSAGTHYVDPVTNLFYSNQVSGVTINVSSSTGTVTQSKVRNGTNVVVEACDLPYN